MLIHLKVKANSLAAEARIIRNLERARLRAARNLAERARHAMEVGAATDDVAAILGWRTEARHEHLSLSHHRRTRVREAARSTHLARMFAKGRAYHEVEQLNYTEPNWHEVARLLRAYADASETAAKEMVDRAKADQKVVRYRGEQPKKHRVRASKKSSPAEATATA